MRLLVACTHCRRQYDVSGLQVGARFHCHCGEAVQVVAPKSHAASVVRCSACGGTREKNSSRCNFCGSDFTLHERDLHTVCPECLARISDRSKFCHHCGVRVTPEQIEKSPTLLYCPACTEPRQLNGRQIGKQRANVMECDACAGLWLSQETLNRLVERASELSRSRGQDHHVKPIDNQGQAGRRYRPCAECRQLMVRRNYARRSGIVVDVCRQHGVWCDANELSNILMWVRSGGSIDPFEIPAVGAVEQKWRPSEKTDDIQSVRASSLDATLFGFFRLFS